jgi:allantoicase
MLGDSVTMDGRARETDLAARQLGGMAVAVSDESFGEKENLLNETPARFGPGR